MEYSFEGTLIDRPELHIESHKEAQEAQKGAL
jgi:hypothetical protein